MSETPEERAARIARVGPSLGDPGYLPYCACPGFHRAKRGPDGFVCATGRCGTSSRKVNGIDMFDETAPDGPGFDWAAYLAREGKQP